MRRITRLLSEYLFGVLFNETACKIQQALGLEVFFRKIVESVSFKVSVVHLVLLLMQMLMLSGVPCLT